MDERGGSLLPIRRKDSPRMAFAQPHDLGRFAYRDLALQYPIQDL